MKTLWITAAASAAAAYACSKIWAPGTLAAAAFTPVLVAIIKEALARSTEVVTRAVPGRGVVRSAAGPEADLRGPRSQLPGGDAPPEVVQRMPDVGAPDLAGVAQAGEIQYHGTSRRTRGLRLAIVTGLLGFVIAAVVFTVPELIAGGSAAGGGGTTLFGRSNHTRSAPAVTTQTQTQTVTPVQTVTAPPATTTTPVAPKAGSVTPPVVPEAGTPTTTPADPTVTAPPTAQPPG